MRGDKRSGPARFSIAMLLCIVMIVVGCSNVERIVIDGETALRMENMTNEQLFDVDGAKRGNSATNMLNGGYVLLDGEDVFVSVSMEFEDGSTAHYLQHLLVSQIGSVNAPNEYIANLNGPMVGKSGNLLFYIDAEKRNRLSYINLETYEQDALFDLPVASAHLLGNKLYVSTEGQGDLYQLDLAEDVVPAVRPTLLYTGGGYLAGVAEGIAYLLGSTEGSSIIRRVAIDRKVLAGRLIGGPYSDIQVAGSWLFFKSGDNLMRQPVSGGTAVPALHHTVSEYAVCDGWLAAFGTDGGIFVSRLDGTDLMQIAEDRAHGLQLMEDKLFYQNEHDGDSIYVIDLIEGKRTALLGETLTDGGIKFTTATGFSDRFDEFVSSVKEKRSYNDQYWGTLEPEVLFAEVSEDGPVTYHRHVDDTLALESIGAIVVISTEKTVLGRYTDGGLAYRLDRKLTLFAPDRDQPLLTLTVEGRPPSQIKSGTGDREGIPLSWHQHAVDLRYLIHAFSQ